MQNSIYNSEELVLFRDQLRKYIESEIVPHGDEWEKIGKVPREVFTKMGELGFLGLRYGEQYGGSELDTVATAVLAEELGRSTFSGFAISVLVHTDMASPHLNNAGNDDQRAKYMPGIITGETVTAVAVTANAASGPDSSRGLCVLVRCSPPVAIIGRHDGYVCHMSRCTRLKYHH